MMLCPPLTFSFNLTLTSTFLGKKISTLEPNLIMPNLSPKLTVLPSLTLQTILLAIKPAICLNKILHLPFLIPLVLFLCYLMVSNVEYEMMPKFSFREGKKNSIIFILILLTIVAGVVFQQKAIFPIAMSFVLFYWIRSLVHHHEEDEDEELLDVSISD